MFSRTNFRCAHLEAADAARGRALSALGSAADEAAIGSSGSDSELGNATLDEALMPKRMPVATSPRYRYRLFVAAAGIVLGLIAAVAIATFSRVQLPLPSAATPAQAYAVGDTVAEARMLPVTVCEDAIGISTPWGRTCKEIRSHCSDVDVGSAVQKICPLTCGVCGGGSLVPAPQAPVPPVTQPVKLARGPLECIDAQGIDTPWGNSCTAIRAHCNDPAAGADVRRICPQTCGLQCDQGGMRLAPVPASTFPPTTLPPSTRPPETTTPPPATPAPTESPVPTPAPTAATTQPPPPTETASPAGAACEDQDTGTCKKIAKFCSSDTLGEETRNACKKTCGLCSGDSSSPYDCDAGFSNWQAGWSEEKKRWCCDNKARGCTEQKTYDCEAGFANWESGWSDAKKAWCCQNQHMGCPGAMPTPVTPEPSTAPPETSPPPRPTTTTAAPTTTAATTAPPPPTTTAKPRPAECGEAGDDCGGSKCCKKPGFQCYEKNEYFATCRKECTAGMTDKGDTEAWSCNELGERTPYPPEMLQCSWPSDNCQVSKCCRLSGYKCYDKDGYFASCRRECTPGPNPKDNDDAPWTCKELGGENASLSVAVDAAPEGQGAGQSLFCIAVSTPNTPEGDLLSQMEQQSLGIFQCDDHAILSGEHAEKGAWQSIKNAMQFVNVWKQVKDEGKFWAHDWTVKVDPDAVFFPQRLKQHLQKLNPPKDTPMYLNNCGFKFKFMGSLEVLSTKAVEALTNNVDTCVDKLGLDGGEDFFVMTCMDASGVRHMEDTSLLRDRYDFVAFPGDFDVDSTADCDDGWAVAFHPHKSWDSWQQCMHQSQGQEK